MTNAKMEARLTAIENQLAQLKANASAGSLRPVELLERIHNTLPNDSATQEAMRLGRAWRRADRKKQSRK